MDNYSKIYWLTRLDIIHDCFMAVFVLCCIVTIFYLVGYFVNIVNADDIEDYVKHFGKYKKSSIITGCILAAILIFMPTKNDIILIYAGGKTMEFVQQDSSLSKIPHQATKMISDYLDEQISEMKKTK